MAERLFEEFPPIGTEAWLAQVEKDLKGAPLSKLMWENGAGITQGLVYRAGDLPAGLDGQHPGESGARRGQHPWMHSREAWELCLELPLHDHEAAAQALEALEHFPDAVRFLIPDGATPDWARLMAPVLRHQAAVHLMPMGDGTPHLVAVAGEFQRAGQEPRISGPHTRPEHAGATADLGHPGIRARVIDLEPLSLAGADGAQELAFALSMAADHAQQHPGGPAQAFQGMAFRFPISSDFFAEIARLRAFRMLWWRVLEAHGLDPHDRSYTRIHATGSRRSLSALDAPTNMLRATTQAMSAILGGADSISVPAYDEAVAAPNAQSARLAANLQRVLRHEAFLDRVIDPGGGSYFLEQLTDQVAERAWALFQTVEAAGGFLAYQHSGALQALLSPQAEARAAALRKGKATLIGVNQYPDAADAFHGQAATSAADRDAAPWEALRAAAAQAAPVRAWLLPFGDLAMRQARANFSFNLLGCGGIHVSTGAAGDVDAALKAQPQLVVLCAADADYLAEGPALLARLRAALPGAWLILAGRPAGWEGLQAHGLDACVYLGMDRLAWLWSVLRAFSNPQTPATHAS